MNIYPAIDIKNGKCVRLAQGDFNNETIYSDDPIKVALEWKNKGAKWLHIIDLDGTKKGKVVNKKTIKGIKDITNLKVQVGGGIRSIDDANSLIEAGVDQLIIGTIAFNNPKLLKELLKKFPGKIIVSVDAKNGQVRTHAWLKETKIDVTSAILNLEKIGVKNFIYTDILKDGMMSEPNYQAIEKLVSQVNSPLIIAGGISNIEQIKKLKEIGADGVILGKALYEKSITLEEALKC